MSRADPGDVQDLFDTELSKATLREWIDIATVIVDDIASADPNLSETRLEKIEMLLTIHFASAQDPQVEGFQIADGSVTYQGEFGQDIRSTSYGQRALMLDTTGTLDSSGKGSASVTVFDSRGISDG